jgi:hypothetical protein
MAITAQNEREAEEEFGFHGLWLFLANFMPQQVSQNSSYYSRRDKKPRIANRYNSYVNQISQERCKRKQERPITEVNGKHGGDEKSGDEKGCQTSPPEKSEH